MESVGPPGELRGVEMLRAEDQLLRLVRRYDLLTWEIVFLVTHEDVGDVVYHPKVTIRKIGDLGTYLNMSHYVPFNIFMIFVEYI